MQNREKADPETEKEDDDDVGDDEGMPETIGRPSYDTSEHNDRYARYRQTLRMIHTIQIHTDGEITGDNTETMNRRSNGNVNKSGRYASILYA